MGHWEELKTELVSKLILVVVYTAYGIRVLLFAFPYKREREQFPLKGILRHAYKREREQFPLKGILCHACNGKQ